MSLEWETFVAEDYCLRVADGTHDSPKEVEYGKKLVTSKNIIGGKLDLEKSYFISLDDFNEVNKRSKVDQWDILISMIGTVGEIALIKEKPDFAIKNVGLLKNNDEYKAKWLYYYLKSELGQYQIKSRLRGTTQLYIPLKDLRKLEIKVPKNHEDMIKIVRILDNIDKKIENCLNINHNLEEQIKSLFVNWFQNFEPFKNEEFYDTKLGNIPVGWKIGTLSDLLKLTKNSIKPGENNDLPYVPIDIIPMNSLGLNKLNSNDEAKSSLITFDKNDILIGAMRVYFHRVAIAPCNGITRSTCFVLKPKKDFYLSYALALCNLNSTIDYAQNTSKGSTMPYAVWKNGLGDMEIIIPPDEILLKFSNLIFPMIELIRDSMYHRINLENLRDTLLPKLMSGEIDVSKINCDLKLIIRKFIFKIISYLEDLI